jgi:hypothetical protein
VCEVDSRTGFEEEFAKKASMPIEAKAPKSIPGPKQQPQTT